MRVGLTTSVIQRGQTGIARYVLSLVRALTTENTAPAYQPSARGQSAVTGRPVALDLVLFVLQDDLALFDFAQDGATIVPVPERFRSPARDILWHQTTLPRLARQYRLDVLHVPSYRRMLWPQPCPLVATIHDLAAFHVKRKYDWKRMFYGRVVARYLAQRQTKIITVSQSTAHDLQRFFAVPRECISVIYNGIDHDRFRPPVDRQTAQDAVARRYGLNQPFFLYVARLEHPGKNHLRLIEAFNRFKHETGSSWKLAFGGSDWHGAHAIHAAITQSVYANDIHCLGFVADAELPQLYWAAETFVYPSLFEGFGLPPLEAMACGCPVVCSTRGSLGEVVGDAAITIDPENVDEITLALARTATEHELRARLQSLGIETAKRFTWESCARGTLDTYATAYSSSFTSARAARLRVANSAPPMGAGDSSLASERARR